MNNSSTDEEGKSNPAAGSSLEDDNESPVRRRARIEENLLNAATERDSWYPRLLRGNNRFDSFPAGLEISAISVASLYDAHDEIHTMDR